MEYLKDLEMQAGKGYKIRKGGEKLGVEGVGGWGLCLR